MTYQEMVYCVTVGISAGMVFKLLFELLFYSIRKMLGWLSTH